MADYTLSARVTADTGDFESGMADAADALDKLEGEAAKAGSSASKAGSGVSGFSAKCSALTGAVMGAAASITSNLVGSFGDLVSSAAEAADSTQKFKNTLSFAGLGTDEIEALSKSTRAYADQTVYSLSDIQNTTAQLAANGVKDYDRLAEAAGNLNAVAGGNADTFKSVGMVLTQTAGQGKLTTENFNQLADAIPGASGKIQQALADMGAYTGNFRDAMEEGQISAQEFNDAIMSLGFEEAAVKAATSTSTIEGAMGNLQATLEGGLADSIVILTPAITGLANSISENLGPAFEVFNGFLQTFVDGLDAGKDPLQAFADAFVTLPEPVQQAATAVGALAAAFAVFKTVQTVTGFVTSFQQALSGIGAAAGPAASSLGPLSGGMSGVSTSAMGAAAQIAAVGVAALGIGAGIGAAAAGLSLLVQAAIQLGSAGPAAQIAMVGLVAGIVALAAGAVAAGPALTAAAVGVGVFGAAVLGIGAGIGIASAGLALLAGQLPTIAAAGGSAGAAMLQIAAGATAMGAALVVAGAGCVTLAVGLASAAVGTAAFAVGIAAAAAAAAAAAFGFGALGLAMGGVADSLDKAGDGVSAIAKGLPEIGTSAGAAASGLAEVTGAASDADSAIGKMNATLESTPGALAAAEDGFGAFAESASSAASDAESAISEALSRIQNEVSSIRLRLPRIEVGPLPHFSMSGRFDPKTGAVPSVSVNWYASGGVFDGASIIGVGERGAEAVVPLTGRRMRPFAEAIADGIESRGGAQQVTQTINFNQPVQTPYQMARALKRQQTYGLAGAR